MKILLTGASSFTGTWFAGALAAKGHHVVASLRRRIDEYEGLRRARVERLRGKAELVEGCSFGAPAFVDLVASGGIDVLCHHAADVTNYKSLDFDVVAALAANANGLSALLKTGRERGLKAVVLTGSVFEQNEGAGSTPLRAFSPYGLSKGLTSQVFAFWCGHFGIPIGKFVIPNPFGPWEEPRFCHYLMQCWTSGKVAEVKTPAYVRDNIHVSLLAEAYASFVAHLSSSDADAEFHPSGYVESQGAFAERFRKEVCARLRIDGRLTLATQTEFPEPAIRINTDRLTPQAYGWREKEAWDEVAAYYADQFSIKHTP